MKSILLADFCSFKGHHESYFMKALVTLIDAGYYVFLHSTDNSKLAENIYAQNLQHCQVIDLKLSAVDKVVRRFLLLLDLAIQALRFPRYLKPSSLCNLIATNRLTSQIGERVPVFFSHVDSILPAVPSLISSRFMPDVWSGIYIMPSYHSSVHLGRFKSSQRFYAERTLTLTSCKSLLVLNPIYQTFFRKTCPNLDCLYLPELCVDELSNGFKPSSDFAWSIKEKASGRIIISVLGALTKKKNLLLFLEFVTKLDSERYFPVVVGQLYKREYSQDEIEKINELVQKLTSTAFVKLDYHIPSETEFAHLIHLSDIIYIQYQNHPFSSNILVRAIMHRKPVIVSSGYLMEQTVKRYKWQVVAQENCDNLVEAIHFCTDKFQIDEECYQKFRTDYSEEKFDAALLIAVKRLAAS